MSQAFGAKWYGNYIQGFEPTSQIVQALAAGGEYTLVTENKIVAISFLTDVQSNCISYSLGDTFNAANHFKCAGDTIMIQRQTHITFKATVALTLYINVMGSNS